MIHGPQASDSLSALLVEQASQQFIGTTLGELVSADALVRDLGFPSVQAAGETPAHGVMI